MTDDENEFLIGVKAIAQEMRRPPRQALRLIQHGLLPTIKIAGRVATTRRLLAEWRVSCEERARAELAARTAERAAA